MIGRHLSELPKLIWTDDVNVVQMGSTTTRVVTVSGGYDSEAALNEDVQNFGVVSCCVS